MASGATSPGITSSSPVDSSATRGRRATCSRSRPTLAASPSAAGVRRSPRDEHDVAPGHVLAGAADPLAGASARCRCARCSAPSTGGRRPPASRPRRRPRGIGAPVKMRAARAGGQRRADAAGRDALRHRQHDARRRRSRRRARRSRPSSCCRAAARSGRRPRPAPARGRRPRRSRRFRSPAPARHAPAGAPARRPAASGRARRGCGRGCGDVGSGMAGELVVEAVRLCSSQATTASASLRSSTGSAVGCGRRRWRVGGDGHDEGVLGIVRRARRAPRVRPRQTSIFSRSLCLKPSTSTQSTPSSSSAIGGARDSCAGCSNSRISARRRSEATTTSKAPASRWR